MVHTLPCACQEMIFELLPANDRTRLNMAMPKGQKIRHTAANTSYANDKKLGLVAMIVKHKHASKRMIPDACKRYLKEHINDITVKELSDRYGLDIDAPQYGPPPPYMPFDEFKAKLLAGSLTTADMDHAFMPRPDDHKIRFLVYTDAPRPQLDKVLSYSSYQIYDLNIVSSLFNYNRADIIPQLMLSKGACFGLTVVTFESYLVNVKQILGNLKHCRHLVWEHVPMTEKERLAILDSMMDNFDLDGVNDFIIKFGSA
jgi:hypothetical protein